MLKPVYFILGWIFFVIGIIGIFIPLLPTTPFLLLTALLFSKSSPRFHAWLLKIPVAGRGIEDWRVNRVIRPKAKVLCVTMVSLTAYFLLSNPRIPWQASYGVSLGLGTLALFVVTRKSSP